MDCSLLKYPQGTIVWYNPPTDSSIGAYGEPTSHPVMVLTYNYAESCNKLQCMLLTTKDDFYYGYRLYLNTTMSACRKMSIVACTKVHTLDATYMGDIIGFAPPHFVKKCLKAYLWILGLCDEIPEFYREDAYAFDLATAGVANIPKTPDTRSYRKPDGAIIVTDTTVASYTRRPPIATDRKMLNVYDIPPINMNDRYENDATEDHQLVLVKDRIIDAMKKQGKDLSTLYEEPANNEQPAPTDKSDSRDVYDLPEPPKRKNTPPPKVSRSNRLVS